MTPSLDVRCPQTAGRCEKKAGHEGDHYTTYADGVWREAASATPPLTALTPEHLAQAMVATSAAPHRDSRHYVEWAEAILARLDEGSATPREQSDD